jgi:hypothetical protein
MEKIQNYFHSFDLKNLDYNSLKWDNILDNFIRILGVLTLLRGVAYWECIVGYDVKVDFALATPAFQTLLVFMAIVSLIAGVGLWMLNKWGSALWIFLVIVILVVDFMMLITPNMNPELARPFYKTLFDLMLIFLYFGISIQTALWESKHLRI